MKYWIIYLIIIIPFVGFSQAPLAFNYQGLALDKNGKILANEQIEIEMSIVLDSTNGTEVYREAHTVQTSSKGIFSLQIGKGQSIFRNFSNIAWDNGNYWITIFADLDLDQQLEEIGSAQFISVPFALHAKTAENVDDADADPLNELQLIQKNGSTVELFPNGGSFQDDVNDADSDPLNEIQNLSAIKNGPVIELNISDGIGTTLSVADSDSDPLNEIQQLSFNNGELEISQGNKVSLSSLGTPWKDRGQTEIFYDEGTVTVEDPNLDNSIVITPLRVRAKRASFASRLEPTTLIFEPHLPSDSVGTNYGLGGGTIFKGGVAPARNLVSWNKDAYSYHYGNQGSFGANSLSYQNTGPFGGQFSSELTSDLLSIKADNFEGAHNAFGSCYLGDQSDVCINNAGWAIYKTGVNPGKNLRWFMDGDSLYGQNENTFKTHLMNFNSNSLSGEFSLYNGSTGNQLFYMGDLGFGDQSSFMALSYDDQFKILHATQDGIGQTIYAGPNGSENIRLEESLHNDNHGQITIHDHNGDETGIWGVDNQGRGFLNLAKNQGDYQMLLSTDFISMTDQSNTASWYVKKDDSSPDASQMFFNGANSNLNVYLGTNFSKNNDNIGELTMYDTPGNARAKLDGDGELKLFGPNGNLNFEVVNDQLNPNEGRLDLHDQNGVPQAGMFIDVNGFGHVFADIKNFKSDHPTNPDKEIWYASLEGPEAGAYCRGTAHLKNGECFIPYPEHFAALVSSKEITVVLTPLFWDTYGLAVIEKTEAGIRVKELKGGFGNFDFDWEIKGKRKGLEDFQVIQDKKRNPIK